MIDRRVFLGSLAASSVIGPRSMARILNDGVENALGADSPTQRPGPRPQPNTVQGVRHCVIDLNGDWQFSATVPSVFSQSKLNKLRWTPVQMPNELEMLGLSIKPDTEYGLRRSIEVPQDYAGKTILLRFDGVYSYARIWVNGHYLREHHGGFTSWDCDITQHVQPGKNADLVVVVVDRSDDPSGASQYAKHNIAGILRDVSLLALPPKHVQHLQLSASLDESYQHGLLDVRADLSAAAATSAASIKLSLRDPAGTDVPLQIITLAGAATTVTLEQIRIPNVLRWDAEHPNLYELTIELHSGENIEILKKPIGFRKIERVGNELRVNGQRIILRGVCRHDIHPTRGRSPLRRNDEQDPLLFRNAHLNFVRTSHYPPTEAFLAACDRVGLYVEEETAVCFANTGGSDPALKDRFLSQFEAMLARDHAHPSVILWSLGNESAWGPNFSAEQATVREVDPTRPIIFSWPDTTGADQRSLDIYSSHYPVWDSDLGSHDAPVLHDEFAHVACYNTDDLRRDPGIRNFWGRSIAIFAQKFLEAPGCLGGSIWAGIDDVFLLPDRIAGYGPWGILDGWRREKPEYWLTRKAFSPIRLEDGILPLPQSGEGPVLTLGNGYNHTNLKELTIDWAVGHQQGTIQGPDVPPHQRSQLRLPVTELHSGQILKLCFRSPQGAEIDRFELPLGARITPVFPSADGTLSLHSTDDDVTISGPKFSLTIDRKTGLIRHAEANARPVIESGPFLDLGHDRPKTWTLSKMEVHELTHSITVAVSGTSQQSETKLDLQFELEVFGDGRLDLRYRLPTKPDIAIDKLGMSFVLPTAIDRLSWHGQSLWSVYPDDHIGRPHGTAHRTSPKSTRSIRTARTAPNGPWAQDMHDPFLDGDPPPPHATTNDFRSLKENVFSAGGFQGNTPEHLRVEGHGDLAIRASATPDGHIHLHIYNFWRYPSLEFGNYDGPHRSTAFAEQTHPPAEQKISLRIADARVEPPDEPV